MRSIGLIFISFLLSSLSNAQDRPVNATQTLYKCDLHDTACEEKAKNAELIDHILQVFSQKKGDKIIYTTENLEDLLEKIRAFKVSKSDLKSFREDPGQCVEKLKPLLQIVGNTVGFTLNQSVLDEFCLEASLLYNITYYSVRFVRTIYANPGTSIFSFAIITAIGTRSKIAKLQVGMLFRALSFFAKPAPH